MLHGFKFSFPFKAVSLHTKVIRAHGLKSQIVPQDSFQKTAVPTASTSCFLLLRSNYFQLFQLNPLLSASMFLNDVCMLLPLGVRLRHFMLTVHCGRRFHAHIHTDPITQNILSSRILVRLKLNMYSTMTIKFLTAKSCRLRELWHAEVHGVAKSRT